MSAIDHETDLDLADTVDGVPLTLILAVKGLLGAASRLWPELDDVPAEIREQLWELHTTWVDEVERALGHDR